MAASKVILNEKVIEFGRNDVSFHQVLLKPETSKSWTTVCPFPIRLKDSWIYQRLTLQCPELKRMIKVCLQIYSYRQHANVILGSASIFTVLCFVCVCVGGRGGGAEGATINSSFYSLDVLGPYNGICLSFAHLITKCTRLI